jgi:hypothetical protein
MYSAPFAGTSPVAPLRGWMYYILHVVLCQFFNESKHSPDFIRVSACGRELCEAIYNKTPAAGRQRAICVYR